MSSGENVRTITINLPEDLKVAVEQAAAAKGTTLTNFVRQALADALVPPNRVTELAGLSQRFDDFLASDDLKSTLGRALLVAEQGPYRFVFHGQIIEAQKLGGTIRLRQARGGGERVLLRKDIVAWHWAKDDMSDVIQVLQQGGYQIVS